MSSGERVHNRNPPPLGYQHLTDGHLFDEPTAPPPPLKELPYPYGLGDGDGGVQGSVFVAKQWEGLLVPTKLQLLCNHKGESVVVKVHEGVLQENVARLKSIYCNHPGWCIVGVRACIVEKCTAPPRLSGSHEHVTVYVVQEYMDLHSFKDILLPPPLPQRPPAVPEAACAWAAKCVLRALRYIGSCRHVVHCNIRPSSILLDRQGNVCVTDIQILGNEVPSTLSFSYLPLEFAQMERTKYSCPDRLEGKRTNSSTDIWSLGMCLLEMHLGHYVYDTPRSRDKYSSMMLMDMIQGEDLPEAEPDLDTNMVPLRLVDLLEKGCYPDDPPPPPISQHFASFLRACLNPTSSKRPPAEKLLQHDWVKDAQRSDLSEWLQKEGVTSVPRAIQCKQREEALAASRAAANAPDAPAPPSTSTLLGVAAQFDGSGVSKGQ